MPNERIPNEIVFDESGLFADEMDPVAATAATGGKGRCKLGKLTGSWFVQLLPKKGQARDAIRGVMRLEAGADLLRLSGDVYVQSGLTDSQAAGLPAAITPDALVIGDNWYPSFPQGEYRWYFRSLSASYKKRLFFRFARHLWDREAEGFVGEDRGWMRLRCRKKAFSAPELPAATTRMAGIAMVGGKKYDVVATRTSPFYRGCLVEVDAMRGRDWPDEAPDCFDDEIYSLQSVLRDAGVDAEVIVSDLNLPAEEEISHFELQDLMSSHRSVVVPGEQWHLWLLVGSRYQMLDALGLMFDVGKKPYREGAAVFFDVKLPNLVTIRADVRGKKLGAKPLPLLRTLIHEVGHVFNLFHPKDDVHGVAVGTTLMNQGGDLLLFASEENPYPCIAKMSFNQHNHDSLLHSCDPQVRPGGMPFGWGHRFAAGGTPQTVDALGLRAEAPAAEGLGLSLELPREVVRGDYVMAVLTLENLGKRRRRVLPDLHLAAGDLRLRIVEPDGRHGDLRDVVLACKLPRRIELGPGESLVAAQQLFYTARGLTFDRPGSYRLRAEMSVGDESGTVARGDWVEIVVRPAATRAERARESLSMDPEVGLSLALGGFGADEGVERKLSTILRRYGSTDIGRACGLALANGHSRDHRDLRAGKVARRADPKAAKRALRRAMAGASATRLASLAESVASSGGAAEPVVEQLRAALKSAKRNAYKKPDLERALRMLDRPRD